jgi:hypothetical protein
MDNKEQPKKKGLQVDFASLATVGDIHTPQFKEDKKADIVKYGKDNKYPDFLLDLFINKSSKHRAIIEKKVNMIAGQGFEFDNTQEEARRFWENERGSHNLDDLGVLTSTDYEVFYAFALIVRWNDDKTKPVAIDYMPVHKVRKGLTPKTWWVSDNWTHYKKPESKTRKYVEFDNKPLPENFDTLKKEEKRLYLNQIVYFKNLTIGSDAYPHVPYQPAIHYLMADYQIGKFTHNNVKNNYIGGYHIDFVGEVPEAPERAETKSAFLNEYTNSESSNVVFTWTPPDSTRGTTLTPLPTNGSEDAFLNVDRAVLDNIFIAHSVTTPLLFGIREAGTMGGRAELEESLGIFQATEITPKQAKIESPYNMIAKIAEAGTEFRFGKYKLAEEEVDVEDANSFNTLSPLVATKILDAMTINEIRSLGGQPPVEGGDELDVSSPEKAQFMLQFSDEDRVAMVQKYFKKINSK